MFLSSWYRKGTFQWETLWPVLASKVGAQLLFIESSLSLKWSVCQSGIFQGGVSWSPSTWSSGNSWSTHQSLESWLMMNFCYFSPLSFRTVCYTWIDKQNMVVPSCCCFPHNLILVPQSIYAQVTMFTAVFQNVICVWGKKKKKHKWKRNDLFPKGWLII